MFATYANISVGLSVLSFALFFLFGFLHWRLWNIEWFADESNWLSWGIVTVVRMAAAVAALAAFIVSLVAMKKCSKQLSVPALVLSILALYLSLCMIT
jgi:hypothetical protein